MIDATLKRISLEIHQEWIKFFMYISNQLSVKPCSTYYSNNEVVQYIYLIKILSM